MKLMLPIRNRMLDGLYGDTTEILFGKWHNGLTHSLTQMVLWHGDIPNQQSGYHQQKHWEIGTVW